MLTLNIINYFFGYLKAVRGLQMFFTCETNQMKEVIHEDKNILVRVK